jgi:hypothetical protein
MCPFTSIAPLRFQYQLTFDQLFMWLGPNSARLSRVPFRISPLQNHSFEPRVVDTSCVCGAINLAQEASEAADHRQHRAHEQRAGERL